MAQHSVKHLFAHTVALFICALLTSPAHAVEPRVFIVFFAFGSFELDGNARSILAEYAQMERELGRADLTITLIGHTDSVESMQLPATLSQQRTEVVRSALIELGVAGNRMSTLAKGASETIVGGSDAQSRRVQIDYHFPTPQ